MLYTGIDYHRSFSYLTTMDEKGEIIGQKKLPSNGEIVDFLKEFDPPLPPRPHISPYLLRTGAQLEGIAVNVRLTTG